MKQEQFEGAFRAVLTLVGTYLFGHNIFGNMIDASLWQEISGAGMVLVSFIWSISSKCLTLEILQSTLLKVVMVAGGLLVTSGRIAGATLNAFVMLLTAIIPMLYSYLSKKKSAGIATLKIDPSELAK
ncbi:MAG: hypothetical protein H7258_05395 [Ferruginibacter sp.]|nr:hypothetical protein [Ferruginibacter sp.]